MLVFSLSLNTTMQYDKTQPVKRKITVASAKAKGRNLQQWTRDKLRAIWPELAPECFESTPMGSAGSDVVISPEARAAGADFSVECKAYSRHAVYGFIDQAAAKRGEPLVVVKADRRRPLVVVDAEFFFGLVAALRSQ